MATLMLQINQVQTSRPNNFPYGPGRLLSPGPVMLLREMCVIDQLQIRPLPSFVGVLCPRLQSLASLGICQEDLPGGPQACSSGHSMAEAVA